MSKIIFILIFSCISSGIQSVEIPVRNEISFIVVDEVTKEPITGKEFILMKKDENLGYKSITKEDLNSPLIERAVSDGYGHLKFWIEEEGTYGLFNSTSLLARGSHSDYWIFNEYKELNTIKYERFLGEFEINGGKTIHKVKTSKNIPITRHYNFGVIKCKKITRLKVFVEGPECIDTEGIQILANYKLIPSYTFHYTGDGVNFNVDFCSLTDENSMAELPLIDYQKGTTVTLSIYYPNLLQNCGSEGPIGAEFGSWKIDSVKFIPAAQKTSKVILKWPVDKIEQTLEVVIVDAQTQKKVNGVYVHCLNDREPYHQDPASEYTPSKEESKGYPNHPNEGFACKYTLRKFWCKTGNFKLAYLSPTVNSKINRKHSFSHDTNTVKKIRSNLPITIAIIAPGYEDWIKVIHLEKEEKKLTIKLTKRMSSEK